MIFLYIDPNWVTAIGTILLVVATLILAFVAWRQIRLLRLSQQVDVVIKLRDEFFSDEMNDYLKLIEDDSIIFDEIFQNFRITGDKYLLINKDRFKNNVISPNDFDNYLLGHLDDIGKLVITKIIKFDLIYHFFDYYIKTCGDNSEIMKYINFEKKFDVEIYDNFLHLYRICKRIEEPGAKTRPKPKQIEGTIGKQW